ncbi:MAG: penicillin-binding transpeptidase domain-containing protein [Desulfovibrionaceae bacterium]|nr:penicillin-binding transpeptidase domain-containing protein [Desulfovibrionaceae bacterium]
MKKGKADNLRRQGIIPMLFIACALVIFLGHIWLNFYDLQINQGRDNPKIRGYNLEAMAENQNFVSERHTGRRGSIVDRNGVALSSSVGGYSLALQPLYVKDSQTVAAFLEHTMDMPEKNMLPQINSGKKYIELARNLPYAQAKILQESQMPAGLLLFNQQARIYQNNQQAAQLLGFAGMDSVGREGLELVFENWLAGKSAVLKVQTNASGKRRFYHSDEKLKQLRSLDGQDLHLTIDSTVQHYAEQALAEAVRENEAQWGGTLVIHIPSGEILAWAQAPLINPNMYGRYSQIDRRNRIALDAVEFGSTVKPFLLAAALEEGQISTQTVFDAENGKWTVRNKTITDTRPRDTVTLVEAMKYSSNIAMGKTALLLGAKKYHAYLNKMGFGRKSSLPLSGENPGILRPPAKWSELDLAAAGFGQGFSATLLQMGQAYFCLANQGVNKTLRLIMNKGLQKEDPEERIFSAETAETVLSIMEMVVSDEDGGGRAARMPWVRVLGKTGTSQLAEDGVYGEQRAASFAGMAPAEKPELLILVVLVDPQKNKFGATAAVPVFKSVLEDTLTYLGRLPDPGPDYARAAPPVDLAAYTRKKAKEDARLKNNLYFSDDEVATDSGDLARGRLGERGFQNITALQTVPDMRGLGLHEAAGILSIKKIVPLIHGQGSNVFRQSPPPGADWPTGAPFVIWLEDKSL